MFKRSIHQQKHLIFRRWSRKAWAVQAAIGKQVKIGCLSVDICDAAYKKTVCSGTAISLLLAGRAAFLSDDEISIDETPPSFWAEVTSLYFLKTNVIQASRSSKVMFVVAESICNTFYAFSKRTLGNEEIIECAFFYTHK